MDISRRLLLAQALAAAPVAALGQPSASAPLRAAAAGLALSGLYPGHLQGVCTNERDAVYWSMTTHLVKTDIAGNILRKIAVATHHGDLCHLDGKIYVAVNHGLFNDPQQRSDSWIYVYDAGDLAFVARHKAPEMIYGAGGIAFANGRFVVVGGLPEGVAENEICEYAPDLTFIRKVKLATGPIYKGVQTAAYNADHWWFGCYGKPDFTESLIRTDKDFGGLQRFAFDASTGIVPLDRDTFLVAKSACGKDGCVAQLAPVRLDAWIETGRLRAL